MFQQIEASKVLLFLVSYLDDKTKSIENMLFLQSKGITSYENLMTGVILRKFYKVVYQ